MQTKSEKLKRLVTVQRHLERMAEHELSEVARQRDVVEQNLNASVEAVGSLDPVHQIFSSLYSNQISRLTIKGHQLMTMQQIQEQKILREKAKADRLEDNMMEARSEEDRADADARIYDLVDQKVAFDHAQASSKLG